MQVLGVDDLAALATSFNEMAASLQGKLRELEELSSVQRQFVSDVSPRAADPAVDHQDGRRPAVRVPAGPRPGPAAGRSSCWPASWTGSSPCWSTCSRSAGTTPGRPRSTPTWSTCATWSAARPTTRSSWPGGKGSRIEFRLPATGCLAEVDRRRVERILRNILVNAVEHGEGKDVVVTCAIDSAAVAVSVRDYGVGLRPGEEQRVFERFWRADPARARTTGGTGLGLAISLEDARLHGGWLQAWGERGKGSVFRLTLPRVAGQELAGSPLPLGPDEAEIAAGLSAAEAVPGGRPDEVASPVASPHPSACGGYACWPPWSPRWQAASACPPTARPQQFTASPQASARRPRTSSACSPPGRSRGESVPDRAGIPDRQRQLSDLQHRPGIPGQLGRQAWNPGWAVRCLSEPDRAQLGSGPEGQPERQPAGLSRRRRRRCRPASTAPASTTSRRRARASRRVPRTSTWSRSTASGGSPTRPDYRLLTALRLPAVLQGAGSVLLRPAGPGARPGLGVRAAGRHRVAAARQPGRRARRGSQDAVAARRGRYRAPGRHYRAAASPSRLDRHRESRRQGAARPPRASSQLFYAQLVWTLTGSAANLPSIQSVVLELNGLPWTPRTAPCCGRPELRFPTRRWPPTSATTRIRRRRPASTTSSAGSCGRRCGSEALALQGYIGSVAPVVSRTGALTSQRCAARRNRLRRLYRPRRPLQPRALPAAVHGGRVAGREVPGHRLRRQRRRVRRLAVRAARLVPRPSPG